MGLTILPYRIQSALPSYSNPRRRVLFRPLTSPISSSLEIHTRNRPLSAHANQRQFRPQSILSSPSFLADNLLLYRLPHRSHSTSK